MKENNYNKRLFAGLLTFLLTVHLFAQSWVIDETSKDNSGGIFTGIIGLILLLGIIWVVGYIFDQIKVKALFYFAAQSADCVFGGFYFLLRFGGFH